MTNGDDDTAADDEVEGDSSPPVYDSSPPVYWSDRPKTPRHSDQALPAARSDVPFFALLIVLGGSYVALILLTLLADVSYLFLNAEGAAVVRVLESDEVQYAAKLSIVSSTITTILALWVAVPIGYLLSRFDFRLKPLVDAILDIPIVLPPLVIGVSLLITFRTVQLLGEWADGPGFPVSSAAEGITEFFVYAVPGVILAQFLVSAAFAVRAMRTAFDEIPMRKEQVALTLGCTRGQAFWHVVLPEARGGLLAAATLTWARSLGEFGPILVFAGATPMRTQVLPTSVFLQLSVGDLAGAVAISLGMVLIAVVVLVVVRVVGRRDLAGRALPYPEA